MMSNPQMKSPLEIPELLMNVFEQMADDQASLAVSARVSRQWSLLALQTLWGSRPIWASQLMSILSEDAKVDTPFHFKQAGVNPLRNQKFITRMPTPAELSRINIYSSLIQYLRFDESDALHPYLLATCKFDNLHTLEMQPMLDTETLLTIGPVCVPSVKRALLLLDDPEDDDSDSDEEDGDQDQDDVFRYHHYDSALNWQVIDYVSRMSPNISILDVAVGPKTSSAFLGLLAPLRDTLTSLTLYIRNRPLSSGGSNPFPLQDLYNLDSFPSLSKLALTVEAIMPAESIGSHPRVLDLPALTYFQVSALSSEQLCDVLPLIPGSITSLLLHDLSLVPNVGSKEPAKEFARALNRFDTLTRFQLLSPAFQSGLNQRKAYLQSLGGLIPSMKHLTSLEVVHPALRFPSGTLAMLGRALPELKELALLTDDLRVSHLRKLAKEAPRLTRLAVAPYVRDDVGNDEGADWDWKFPNLEKFGAVFATQTTLKSPGAVTVQTAIESQSKFLHTFPITCRFGDQDPLVDFFDTESRLYAFQRAADEGGPEGLAGEDGEEGEFSEEDESVDGSVEDDFESMSGDSEMEDEQAVDDEMDGGEEGEGGWVDED